MRADPAAKKHDSPLLLWLHIEPLQSSIDNDSNLTGRRAET